LHDIVCNELRINRSELGNILGVSKTTIDSWSDPSRMSKTTEIALKQMLENHRLKEIFEAQANAYRKFLKYANENSSIEISDTHRTLIDKIRYVLKEYNLNSLTAAKKLKISFEE
ncbi:transcriptional regulator, partial [Campylobacter jejuni]